MIKGLQQVSQDSNCLLMRSSSAGTLYSQLSAMELPSGQKELTVGQWGDVVDQWKQGASFGAITVDLEILEDTASKVWIYYKHTGSYELLPNHHGWPPSLSERDRQHVYHFIKTRREERWLPLQDITEKLNLAVSDNTMHKTIQGFGYNHCIERHKPWLSPTQKKARLQFAETYVKWTLC